MAGVQMSSAIHSGPQPEARTASPCTTNIAANGRRHSGFCHRIQAATGSISGRGTSNVSARNEKMPMRLPRSAQAAARSAKSTVLPVSTSNQNGQLTSVKILSFHPGIANAAAMWVNLHAAVPISATTVKP